MAVFQTYLRPISTLSSFKYLGKVLTAAYDNWEAVISNLSKVCKSWVRMSCILGGYEANARVSGLFYKAVVQAVLIYRLEMWVLTPRMLWNLGEFRHRVAYCLMG